MTPMRAALVAMLTVIAAAALLMLGALALDFLRRTLETPEHLAKRFDFALVSGFLAFGFLQQFQQLVELVQRVPQGGNNLHCLVDRLPDGSRLSRAKIARRTRR